jgi:RNA polymerase sigma factor (sigma-70 family)
VVGKSSLREFGRRDVGRREELAVSPVAAGSAPPRVGPEVDRRALGEIFDAYHQQLYRYCLAILGDRQDAEDALQETMVKVMRALPGERREIALKPWIYRIAHNESIDLLRRRRRNVPLEETEPAVGEALADQVETRQRLRQLIADVGALPERQRASLLMRETGGLEFGEIAAALGTTPAAARQTLYEARLGLREMDAGRAMECAAVTKAISDGDGRVRRRRDIRAHLRGCEDCRRFTEEIDSRRTAFAAISPLPAVAVAAMVRGLGGGGAAAGAAGAGGTGTGLGAAGAGAAKSIGTATLLKGAATLGAAVAIGVGGADLGGVIHLDHRAHRSISPARPATAIHTSPRSDQRSTSGSPDSPTTAADRAAPGPTARTAHLGTARPLARPRRTTPPTPRAETSPPRRAAVEEGTPASAQGGTASTAAREPTEAPAPGEPAVEHPHGKGHVKQTPAAAAHGQETAATAKAKEKPDPEADAGTAAEAEITEESGSADHPEHPDHPAGHAKEAETEAVQPTSPVEATAEPEEAAAEEPEPATEPTGKDKKKKKP